METSEFYKQLEKGNWAERVIERVLQNHGWYTIPTYDYRSEQRKSPRLCGIKEEINEKGRIKRFDEQIVLPDLDVISPSKRIWIECKLEEGASWTYSQKRFEHGFKKFYYDEYLKIEKLSGCELWVFFLEYDQTERTKKDYERYKNKSLPPLIDYPKNILRGQQLRRLSVRKQEYPNRGIYTYFPQDEFLYFGVLYIETGSEIKKDIPLLPLDANRFPISNLNSVLSVEKEKG